MNHFTASLSSLTQEPIRTLEKRALNFLVNEYLLKNEYKLSSITFSDENDDQVKIFVDVACFQDRMTKVINVLSFISACFLIQSHFIPEVNRY